MLKRPENTVNVDVVLALADYIEALPTKNDVESMGIFPASKTPVNFFSMRIGKRQYECGTIGCIKGILHTLYDIETNGYLNHGDEAKFLGVTENQATSLFCPLGWEKSEYTSGEAAQVLRHLALTGEVDWSIVKEKENAETA
jgi:hypothetical protein